MSLLPSFAQKTIISQTAEQAAEAESLYEWDVNFENGQMTGAMVNGSRAVKVWIWKCLMTSRFRHPIYSWAYGSELDSYIGRILTQEYIDTDVRLALEDALLINPEIQSVIEFRGRDENGTLVISFTAITIYGRVSILDYRINAYVSTADRMARHAVITIENGNLQFLLRDGHLRQLSGDAVNRVMKFKIDSRGHLIASMTKEVDQAVVLDLENSTGILRAKYNV